MICRLYYYVIVFQQRNMDYKYQTFTFICSISYFSHLFILLFLYSKSNTQTTCETTYSSLSLFLERYRISASSLLSDSVVSIKISTFMAPSTVKCLWSYFQKIDNLKVGTCKCNIEILIESDNSIEEKFSVEFKFHV